MIRVMQVSKRYGQILALDHLTLEVPQGAVYGLLGPNGSGKTTFIKLLMGFLFPDRGRIDRGSLAPWQIGYLPERPALPSRSPVGEYLTLVGRLSDLPAGQVEHMAATGLERVGLSAVRAACIGTLSKGMLQRLALAVAMLGQPPLVILDEPMEGLDPGWQVTVRELVRDLQRSGQTVLLSTHRLSDVADLCTHLAILDRGHLKRAGAMNEVLPLRPTVSITVDQMPTGLAATLQALHPAIAIDGRCITLAGDAIARKREVLHRLLGAGLDIQDITRQRASLEQVYLEAMDS